VLGPNTQKLARGTDAARQPERLEIQKSRYVTPPPSRRARGSAKREEGRNRGTHRVSCSPPLPRAASHGASPAQRIRRRRAAPSCRASPWSPIRRTSPPSGRALSTRGSALGRARRRGARQSRRAGVGRLGCGRAEGLAAGRGARERQRRGQARAVLQVSVEALHRRSVW